MLFGSKAVSSCADRNIMVGAYRICSYWFFYIIWQNELLKHFSTTGGWDIYLQSFSQFWKVTIWDKIQSISCHRSTTLTSGLWLGSISLYAIWFLLANTQTFHGSYLTIFHRVTAPELTIIHPDHIYKIWPRLFC